MTRVLIEDYPHRRAGHCGSGALRDLIDWAGSGWDGPPSEALVFGMGGGLGFQYFQIPGLMPPIYFVGRTADMELDLCARLGIETERKQTDDAELGWSWVADELDAGRPVMVWADILELPYLRVRLSNTRHDIVVIGYDTDADIAYVVDNDRDGFQAVPLPVLAKARNSSGFPDRNRHATYPMRFPDRLPDLLPVARDAAAAAVANLHGTDQVSAGGSELHLPGGSGIFGLAGVERFCGDIARWPVELDPNDLMIALHSIRVFVEKAGTGGGLFRRLQAGFCHEVAELTGDLAFRAAADAYDTCAQTWSRLAALATTETPDHGEIALCAAKLPAAEHRAVDALAAAAG
ncbi:BtrH N-terminal domain-containing protein [Nocardia sp. NPDC046473]|uniref:BtrH N-terminal domain-containing protein n=1 Tax=Nocardia sp. NPDC046473 TaxID=3155733 RepID=UPI0033DBD52C